MQRFFITGVGTGVGKTFVTRYLIHQLIDRGQRVSVLKPVVSGYSIDDRSSDPVLLLHSLGKEATADAIAAISPWRFKAPLSPHLAAQRERRSVELREVIDFCHAFPRETFDYQFVEGVGGVMSPIGPTTTCLDWIIKLNDPVILVTGSYLGALTHTLTALYVLRSSGISIRGIVVSESADSAGLRDTVESLLEFGGQYMPIIALDRDLSDPLARSRTGPNLAALCINESAHE